MTRNTFSFWETSRPAPHFCCVKDQNGRNLVLEDTRATWWKSIELLACWQQAAAKLEFSTPLTSWHEMNQSSEDEYQITRATFPMRKHTNYLLGHFQSFSLTFSTLKSIIVTKSMGGLRQKIKLTIFWGKE